MLSTGLAALVLLFAVQGLLVVRVADKLTADATGRRDDAAGSLPAAGRYTQLA